MVPSVFGMAPIDNVTRARGIRRLFWSRSPLHDDPANVSGNVFTVDRWSRAIRVHDYSMYRKVRRV